MSSTIKKVHIVAFDLPFPPNYGGSTDMYYKYKALKELDVEVVLHVFLYGGKKPADELKKVVSELHYYPRLKKNPFWGKRPYIVRSRESKKLLERLSADLHPILFEGLHTTAYINHPLLANKVKIVRAHNVEHDYYEALALAEEKWWKTLFFKGEAKRLKEYEKQVGQFADGIAAISPMEHRYFEGEYGKSNYVPAFHSNDLISSKIGTGDYILYHGNLSVPENHRAAHFLVKEVFSRLDIPCIIAGSQPPKSLIKSVESYQHIQLIADVPSDEILDLISNAHANVLVTFQSTGIKLKLLNSLYRGRFVVANRPMVEETGLEDLCFVGKTPAEIVEHIKATFEKSFDENQKQQRKTLLNQTFDNQVNAEKLVNMLFSDSV